MDIELPNEFSQDKIELKAEGRYMNMRSHIQENPRTLSRFTNSTAVLPLDASFSNPSLVLSELSQFDVDRRFELLRKEVSQMELSEAERFELAELNVRAKMSFRCLPQTRELSARLDSALALGMAALALAAPAKAKSKTSRRRVKN